MILESLEVVIPEPLVMRDPVPHRTEPRRDEAIAPLPAMPLLRHETGIKQDAEVLGAGWAAHLEMSRRDARHSGCVAVTPPSLILSLFPHGTANSLPTVATTSLADRRLPTFVGRKRARTTPCLSTRMVVGTATSSPCSPAPWCSTAAASTSLWS